MNFINGFPFGLTAPNPRGTKNHPDEALLNSGLTSADSGLQLDLEIALSGSPSEGPAPPAFSAEPKMR
jgi:hypothetical protein